MTVEQKINELGSVAGSISAIVGLLTLLLFTPIKTHIQKKRNARKREKEANAAAELAEKKDATDFRREVREALKNINKALDGVQDDIGDLQYERLSQAHDFYTTQGWCSTSKKQQLCNMHKSYRDKGRNHLSEHYEEDILNLADNPPARN